jgi:allophanate hydrolase subunit 2
VDLVAFDLANRLVGNPLGAAMVETSGGTSLSFGEPTMVAITGALADVSVVGGPPVGWGAPVVLPVGATLRVGRLRLGARVYVACRGGVVMHAENGDDGRVGEDGENGGLLRIGADPGTAASTVAAPRTELTATVRLWRGPRVDWFVDGSFEQLCASPWTVTSTSSVGLRLGGTPVRRCRDGELPSEGMVEGAVQVPPDGQPIVMLSDHPTTGGYPVIGVVDPRDLTEVAQAAPTTTLRFVTS